MCYLTPWLVGFVSVSTRTTQVKQFLKVIFFDGSSQEVSLIYYLVFRPRCSLYPSHNMASQSLPRNEGGSGEYDKHHSA